MFRTFEIADDVDLDCIVQLVEGVCVHPPEINF